MHCEYIHQCEYVYKLHNLLAFYNTTCLVVFSSRDKYVYQFDVMWSCAHSKLEHAAACTHTQATCQVMSQCSIQNPLYQERK